MPVEKEQRNNNDNEGKRRKKRGKEQEKLLTVSDTHLRKAIYWKEDGEATKAGQYTL